MSCLKPSLKRIHGWKTKHCQHIEASSFFGLFSWIDWLISLKKISHNTHPGEGLSLALIASNTISKEKSWKHTWLCLTVTGNDVHNWHLASQLSVVDCPRLTGFYMILHISSGANCPPSIVWLAISCIYTFPNLYSSMSCVFEPRIVGGCKSSHPSVWKKLLEIEPSFDAFGTSGPNGFKQLTQRFPLT